MADDDPATKNVSRPLEMTKSAAGDTLKGSVRWAARGAVVLGGLAVIATISNPVGWVLGLVGVAKGAILAAATTGAIWGAGFGAVLGLAKGVSRAGEAADEAEDRAREKYEGTQVLRERQVALQNARAMPPGGMMAMNKPGMMPLGKGQNGPVVG